MLEENANMELCIDHVTADKVKGKEPYLLVSCSPYFMKRTFVCKEWSFSGHKGAAGMQGRRNNSFVGKRVAKMSSHYKQLEKTQPPKAEQVPTK